MKSSNSITQRQGLFWLLAIVLILAGVGLRSPWPADEPRFAQIAMEMVHSGQWFFPLRGGELYPDKPPLFMWATALFYFLSGNINWAFLIPNALFSLLSLYLVKDLASRLWDERIGLRAAALLLFTLQFTLQAKTAQIDAMVCGFITLGCYGLMRHLLLGPDWRWYTLGGFFMGLGVITKGVGFLPLLMLIPYVIARWRQPQQNEIRGSWQWALAPIAMLVGIGLWLIPMIWLTSAGDDPALHAYRDNILLKQTAKRYADSWHHIKPFWYYLVSVVPAFWLPMSAMLPWLAPKWWQALKAQDRRILLPLGWIILLLVFFSLSPGKRGVYILPALPMLALISAPYLSAICKRRGFIWLLQGIIAVISVLLLVLAVLGVMDSHLLTKALAEYHARPWGAIFLLAVGGLSCVTLWRRRVLTSWPVFVSLIWLVYSLWLCPLLEQDRTPKNLFTSMQQQVPEDAELLLTEVKEQFLLFSPYVTSHMGAHTPMEKQVYLAWQWLNHHPKGYMLVDENNAALFGKCLETDDKLDLGFAHRQHWLLLHTPKPRCVAPVSPSPIYTRPYQPNF